MQVVECNSRMAACSVSSSPQAIALGNRERCAARMPPVLHMHARTGLPRLKKKCTLPKSSHLRIHFASLQSTTGNYDSRGDI